MGCGGGGLRPVGSAPAGGAGLGTDVMAPSGGAILEGTVPAGGTVLVDAAPVGGAAPVGTGVGGAVPCEGTASSSLVPMGWGVSIGGMVPVGGGPMDLVSSSGIMFPVVLWLGVMYAPDGLPGGIGFSVVSFHDGVVMYGTVLSPGPPVGVPSGVGSP